MSARHSGTELFGLTWFSSMQLQEVRDRLCSVVDHMIDGVVTFDDAGCIESANPAARQCSAMPTTNWSVKASRS